MLSHPPFPSQPNLTLFGEAVLTVIYLVDLSLELLRIMSYNPPR